MLNSAGLRYNVKCLGQTGETRRHGTPKEERKLTVRVSDIPKIARLSTPEKILLLEDLWDTIASDESGVPVPKSHKLELDQRLRRYKADPGKLLSLEQIQTRIEKRK